MGSSSGGLGAAGTPAERCCEAYGEFIGLAKFSAEGARCLREAWRALVVEYETKPEAPFVRAPRWTQAYLTDLLQYLIDAGIPLHPVPIRGRWRALLVGQNAARG